MTAPAATPAALNAQTPGWIPDFLILAAIWGSSFLFMRVAVLDFGPIATSFLRVGIASLFLLPLLLLRGGALADMRRRWRQLFFVGLLNSAIPFALYAFALQSITTGLSAILNATVPLFGALIAWAWLGDRLSVSRVLGLALGFAGVALLAWDKASFKPDASGIAPGWAVLACLGATFCYGIAANYTKRFMSGCPALVAATGSQIGASVGLMPLAMAFWPASGVGLTSHWMAWGAVTAVGVACTGIAYVMYFRLIDRAGPARAMTVPYLVPVFAVAYGSLLLSEPLTLRMLVCGGIIVLGTALATGVIRLPGRAH